MLATCTTVTARHDSQGCIQHPNVGGWFSSPTSSSTPGSTTNANTKISSSNGTARSRGHHPRNRGHREPHRKDSKAAEPYELDGARKGSTADDDNFVDLFDPTQVDSSPADEGEEESQRINMGGAGLRAWTLTKIHNWTGRKPSAQEMEMVI